MNTNPSETSNTLMAAAERPLRLVNRTQELSKLRRAFFQISPAMKLVFVVGKGGLGKSRLVEWALLCAGNPKLRRQYSAMHVPLNEYDWTGDGNIIVANMIDLTDVRLNTRIYFLRAMRDALALEGEADFTHFDAAYDKFQRARMQEGSFQKIQELENEAVDAFVADYNRLAEQYERIVIALDTVERLAHTGSEWLRDKGLIQLEELGFSSQLWLRDQIRDNTLPKTTFLFSGRGLEEGGPFFDLMRNACEQAGAKCKTEKIDLQPFGFSQTQEYFDALAQDWQAKAASDMDSLRAQRMAEEMKTLAGNVEQVKVLCLYTGGQPVLLSLYSDLILEGVRIPERLKDSFADAVARLGTDDLRHDSPERRIIQAEIQQELLNLLFASTSLRSDILRALVRAPRGLDAGQVQLALNAEESTVQVDKIQSELDAMRELSIIKIRPDGRFALQDEIYRIYAEAMASNTARWQYEYDTRSALYQVLEDFAQEQLERLRRTRREYLDQDEKKLHFNSPVEALNISFPKPNALEEQDRIQVFLQTLDWELERIHYALLADIENGFNDSYFDLAETFYKASDEEADAVSQAELQHVLINPSNAFFFKFKKRPMKKNTQAEFLATFKRAVLQEEACRWIKRFTLRGKYDRAIEFADRLEEEIKLLPDTNDRISWQHTFAHGERVCWREYARILRGDNVRESVKILEETLDKLDKLNRNPQDVIVFDRGEAKEYGFIEHPAQPRLTRVIAVVENNIGYGNTTLGQDLAAHDRYSHALKHMRGTGFRAQSATTRNNLARILSEIGLSRARRVCQDALDLRKELGADIPVATSWNTLALIDNQWHRPELAWIEATTAIAYFRRADSPRGLGLALLQLGEALRRLASPTQSKPPMRDRPEDILETAEQALQQALGIFAPGQEPLRLIEAQIEMGCLQRDLIGLFDKSKRLQRKNYYGEALVFLRRAAAEAHARGFQRRYLDALVNIAWTHFAIDDYDRALQAAQEIQDNRELIPESMCIRPDFLPTVRDQATPYVFYQLGKLYNLRGRIAMERFKVRVEGIEKNLKTSEPALSRQEKHQVVAQDDDAQVQLRAAAEAYVLGASYAQLYSPRSGALSIAFDALYDYLKRFNPTELTFFARYAHAARDFYGIQDIKPVNLGDVDDFIRSCFGDYLSTENEVENE